MAKTTKKAARGSTAIGSWPTPERPGSLNLVIPPELIKEFGADFRVVVKFPWPVGIPVPFRYLDKNLSKKIGKNMAVFITPLR